MYNVFNATSAAMRLWNSIDAPVIAPGANVVSSGDWAKRAPAFDYWTSAGFIVAEAAL